MVLRERAGRRLKRKLLTLPEARLLLFVQAVMHAKVINAGTGLGRFISFYGHDVLHRYFQNSFRTGPHKAFVFDSEAGLSCDPFCL